MQQPNSKATSEKCHNLLDFNGEELAKHPASRMNNLPIVTCLPTAYSIHLPLPLISRGHLIHFQYEEILYHGDKWLTDLTKENFLVDEHVNCYCQLLLSMIHLT
jgi:hypothetical protein